MHPLLWLPTQIPAHHAHSFGTSPRETIPMRNLVRQTNGVIVLYLSVWGPFIVFFLFVQLHTIRTEARSNPTRQDRKQRETIQVRHLVSEQHHQMSNSQIYNNSDKSFARRHYRDNHRELCMQRRRATGSVSGTSALQ